MGIFSCFRCDQSKNSRKRQKERVHAPFECICRRKFMKEDHLSQHKESMRSNVKAFPCPDCCLSYHNEEDRQHHLKHFGHGTPFDFVETVDEDKPKKKTRSRRRKKANSSPFDFVETVDENKPKKKTRSRRRKKANSTGTDVCPSCSSVFCSQKRLSQHQKDKNHILLSSDTRKKWFDDFYDRRVTLDKEDANYSRKIVDSTMNDLLSHVRQQAGGKYFNPNVIKAGSFPVKTKIGKADEFDTNIALSISPIEIHQQGKVNYEYTHGNTVSGTTSMKVQGELSRADKGKTIPPGFAVVRVNKNEVPESLIHGDELIPRKVKQYLFNKIEAAKNELALENVDISRKSHGPALTMTIHPKAGGAVKHDINVDMTASLESNVSITEHGWPRKATKQAFGKNVIDKVIDTGTHLVPKKDEFWSISNSKAERSLFSSIDDGNGCRKMVYKTMKKHVQTSKSQSSDGLPGISSHILKTQLLWSIEKHPMKEYWHQNNRDVCFIETMKEMEKSLKEGQLPDYFNPSLNVLEGKDRRELITVAEHLKVERVQFESK